MVSQLLVAIYKMRGRLSIWVCQKFNKALSHCDGAGKEFFRSRVDSCFGLQSTENFPYTQSAPYPLSAHTQPYWKVYFTTEVPLTKCNGSVEILLNSNTPWKYIVIFTYQNLEFIFLVKVGNSIWNSEGVTQIHSRQQEHKTKKALGDALVKESHSKERDRTRG